MSVRPDWSRGERISLRAEPEGRGTIRFLGDAVGATSGWWVGVEWDDPGRGKHDGVHEGVRYFTPTQSGAGSFVRPAKIEAGISLLAGLRARYGSTGEDPEGGIDRTELSHLRKAMNAPFLELVGFERVNRVQSDFQRLLIVCLRGSRIRGVGDEDPATVCPNVRDLDLSENLIASWAELARLGRALPRLRSLTVSDNRLSGPEEPLAAAFPRLTHLVMGQMGYTWAQVAAVIGSLTRLTVLKVFGNRIHALPRLDPAGLSQLRELDLSENPLADWARVLPLASLPQLATLNLNRCGLTSIAWPDPLSPGFAALRFLQLSDNRIADWVSVGQLGHLSVTDIRMRANPILTTTSGDNCRQIFIATIPTLKVLNGSEVFKQERYGAEIDHIKRFGRAYLATLEAGAAEELEAFYRAHPRYEFLVGRYGPPEASELLEVKDDIKSSLISVTIRCPVKPEFPPTLKQLPKTMTIQKLKMLVYRLVKARGHDLTLACVSPDTPEVEVTMDNDLRDISFYSISDGDTIIVTW